MNKIAYRGSQWDHIEGLICCDTGSLENTGTRPTPHQPHGNRKKPSSWHARQFIGLI